MEFKDLLTTRYATKLFRPEMVPEQTMQELFEIVRLAPSGLNIQPWRIKVVTDASVKERLSAATHDEPQITSCSHLLVFCVDTDWAALSRRLGRAMKERTVPDTIWGIVMGIAAEMATLPEAELRAWLDGQVYIALSYALLGARSLGLDCCPMTHFEADKYAEILGLPDGVPPIVLLAVGYAADEPRPKWRYPLEDILL